MNLEIKYHKPQKTLFTELKKNLEENNGIVSLPIIDEETKKVTRFYKATPFPNYKDNDDKQSILEKGNRNILAQQFKKFIGHKKRVLEVGCGTGQLSIYFAIGTNNKIIALDPTIESINLANNFAIKNKISNIDFVNTDITIIENILKTKLNNRRTSNKRIISFNSIFAKENHRYDIL